MSTLTNEQFIKKYGQAGLDRLNEVTSPSYATKRAEQAVSSFSDGEGYLSRVKASMDADTAMRSERYSGIFNRAGERLKKSDSFIEDANAVALAAAQTAGQVINSGANAVETIINETPGLKQAFGALGSVANTSTGVAGNIGRKLGEVVKNSDNPIAKLTTNSVRKFGDLLLKSKSLNTVADVVGLYQNNPDVRDVIDGLAGIPRLAADAFGAVELTTGAASLLNTAKNKIVSGAKKPVNKQILAGSDEIGVKEYSVPQPKPITNPEINTIVDNHVKSAKMIAQYGEDVSTPALINDLKNETLAGLARETNSAFKVAYKQIQQLDPAQFSTIDDFNIAMKNVVNNPVQNTVVFGDSVYKTKPISPTEKVPFVGKVMPSNPNIAQTTIKTANNVKSPLSTGVKLAETAVKTETGAVKSFLGDIIPTKKGTINSQVAQALNFTQGDVKNIALNTGNNVGEFMASNKLIGGDIPETLKKIDDFSTKAYKDVRSEIAKVDKNYVQSDVPRYQDALTTIQSQIKDTVGLEADNKLVIDLLAKKDVSLSDVQKVKELLDKHFSLYKATGDVKEGVTKSGLANVRSDIRKFIETEVKNTTGVDIGKLNNDVSTIRSIQDAAEARSTRDYTRPKINQTDVITFLTGSTVGTPIGGIAAYLGKKIIDSPSFKLRLSRFLDSISKNEEKQILNSLKKDELPKNFILSKDAKSKKDKTGLFVV